MGSKLTGTVDPWALRGAISLMAGPVMFLLVMGIEQVLRPGYSDLSNTISDLGVDTNGWSYSWMFTVSIMTLGLLTLVSAYALTRVLGGPARTATILLALGGVGSIGVGIFDENAYRLPHSIFALDGFVTSALALLFFARVLFRDPRWGPVYARFSRVCGVVSLVSLVFFLVSVGGSAYNGLLERVVVAPGLFWTIIIGLRLFRLPSIEVPSGLTSPAGS